MDHLAKRKKETVEESELGKGNLFATGLVAGGALMGVIVAICTATLSKQMGQISFEKNLVNVMGIGFYNLLGVIAFLIMAFILFRVARSRK